jgi:NADH-quinone oxidoreductase subunit F
VSQDVDLKFVDETIASIGRGPESVIALLQAIQTHYRYLPPEALEHLCEHTDITPAQVTGVSTFYTQFRHKPMGKHLIGVCHGTACHVKGAQNIHDALDRHLGLTDGEDTDADELFTIHKVACLGCCTLAPAVQIDHLTYGHLTPDTVPKMLRDFLASADKHPAEIGSGVGIDVANNMTEIRIGLGSCCVASGSEKIYSAMSDVIDRAGVPAVIKPVGCIGMCHQTPLVEIVSPDKTSHLYAKVTPQDAEAIVRKHFRPTGMFWRFSASIRNAVDSLLTDQTWNTALQRSIDARDKPVADFLSRQKHVATECCGYVNPIDIEEYMSHGGFEAMKLILNGAEPDETIDKILASGLRGRGGAGFPTGKKWREVADTEN